MTNTDPVSTQPNRPLPPEYAFAPTVVAIIWAVAAVIAAIALFVSAKDVSYGGDAYTGMQNAINLAVRGIALLLLGSGALGLIIATRRIVG